MRLRLNKFWDDVRSSFWFLPSLMVLAAMGLSLITVNLDERYGQDLLGVVSFVWGGGADGARDLLSTVAGSMITVASLSFSIIMLAYSQSSTQFGHRLLRTFMHDTGNQVVLGTFTATFIYSLLVLRTVRSADENYFVPSLSVGLAVLMTLASVGVLIYLVHHAALSLSAPHVIAELAGDLFGTIDALLVDRDEGEQEEAERARAAAEEQIPADMAQHSAPVFARADGYLQTEDLDALLEIATRHELIVRVLLRPGHFLLRGARLAEVWPGTRLDDGTLDELQEQFGLGSQRSHIQDVEYGVQQLVEVALRALSPSTNDPYTAMACIDWLTAALARMAAKSFPSPCRCDARGNLRLIVERSTSFSGVVKEAFDQIRQSAGSSAAVRMRLLEGLTGIMEQARREEDREALRRQARMIYESSEEVVGERADLADIAARLRMLYEAGQ
ncbi:MAG: DUF2254 domain-containing protein [Chloroflexi bacterium]|nr:DUF2254 domain-containing protein [Chloroflexota bacterium]